MSEDQDVPKMEISSNIGKGLPDTAQRLVLHNYTDMGNALYQPGRSPKGCHIAQFPPHPPLFQSHNSWIYSKGNQQWNSLRDLRSHLSSQDISASGPGSQQVQIGRALPGSSDIVVLVRASWGLVLNSPCLSTGDRLMLVIFMRKRFRNLQPDCPCFQ